MDTRRPFPRLLALLAALLLAGSRGPAAELRVVTTIPDLADIVRRIGGERVGVSSVARGTENVHAVDVRPSDMIAVNSADLFVQIGLSLEHAWVPGLLELGRNRDVQPGGPGFVNVSEGWDAVDVPEEISRGRAADIHPQGNPHINLSPRAGRFMADRILEGLVRVDPEHAEEYRERHAAYLEELEAARERWERAEEDLKGVRIVPYHPDMRYFALETGLEVVDHVEPKPGVPPTAGDLARVIEIIEREDVGILLTARWSNNDAVRFVAERTGAEVVEVPEMVQEDGEPDTWIELIDTLFEKLGRAAQG